jgi:hypothetical protein
MGRRRFVMIRRGRFRGKGFPQAFAGWAVARFQVLW